jgi:hypothetical protein
MTKQAENNPQGTANIANDRVLYAAFKDILFKLQREIKFERENNPRDYNKISWSNQQGILISVKEAETIVNMYNRMNKCRT